MIEFAGETGREHVGAVVLDALHDGPLRVSPHHRVAAQAPRGAEAVEREEAHPCV